MSVENKSEAGTKGLSNIDTMPYLRQQIFKLVALIFITATQPRPHTMVQNSLLTKQ